MGSLSKMQKADINIRSNVNTDSVNQDVYVFGDQNAPLITNTGIERDGGITNIYEVETSMMPNSTSYITPEGDIIERKWNGEVRLRGQYLGSVNPYSVQDMCSIKQVDDVVLSTRDKTFITCKLVGNTIELYEYDISTTPSSGNPWGDNEITYDSTPTVGTFPRDGFFPDNNLYPSAAGDALHSQVITLGGVSGVTNLSDVYTSLSIVRSDNIIWDGTWEFILRIDTNVYRFTQGNPLTPDLFTGLLTGFNQLNYLYCFKYDGNNYLVNLVGNVKVGKVVTDADYNQSFIISNWGTSTKTNIRCKYAVPQSSGGKTRHLITCDPVIDATRIKSAGFVGYTDFSAFSASEVWSPASSTFTSASYDQPLVYNTGLGYSEYIVKYTTTQARFNVYTPNFKTDDTSYVHSMQSDNTSTMFNYYGKLNNFNNLVPSRGLEFRVNVVNGVQSYLSVAPLDSISQTNGTADKLGVILTEVGAYDDSYQTMVSSDNTILWKANDNFYIVAVDYDAGAGYFNSPTWSEATVTGTAYTKIENEELVCITNSTPAVEIPLATPLKGGQYPYVTIRYKTDDPTPFVMQYTNSQHSYSSSYQKTMTPTADNRWYTMVFDMRLCDTYNTDYVTYNVTGFKLFMGTTNAANWRLFNFYVSYKTIKYVPQVQRVSEAAYKLNTIDPLNIVNIRTGLIEPGSVDYHGQMSFYYTGTQAAISYRVAAQMVSVFSNSIDAGDKVIDCDLAVSTPSSVIDPIGVRLVGNTTYAIDVYASATSAPLGIPYYSFSIKESGTELVDPVKLGTPYQQTLVLPVPMGYRYKEFSVYARSSTIFYNTTNPISIGNIGQGTSVGYDGYTLGNDIPGTYVPFYLFGNRYIQDLTYIYLVQFNNEIYQGKDRIASSIGMKYVGSSPTLVYFLSDFDNSIYTFDGNRSLEKRKRFSQADRIINGLYSTKDNTMVLNGTDSFIWIRDEVVTINPKKFNQLPETAVNQNFSDITIFETRDGLILMNEFYFWAYTYNQLSYNEEYTLVPLKWRSAHFGIQKNQKSILSEYVLTILNVDTTKKVSLALTLFNKDESDHYWTQKRNITLWPRDFNSEGYASIRMKPEQYKTVATSIQLEQIGNDIPKIVLLDVGAELQNDTNAVISARKTR